MLKISRFNFFNKNKISLLNKQNLIKNQIQLKFFLTNHIPEKDILKNKCLIKTNLSNKNFFKKIFQKKEDPKTENLQKDFKYLDSNGNTILNENSQKPIEGQYDFSHETEMNPENEEFEDKISFSVEDIKVEDIGFKQSITKKSVSNESNIEKFANLINVKLEFVSNFQSARYEKLNFEEDLVNLISQMKEFGFDDRLIKSIFRKK